MTATAAGVSIGDITATQRLLVQRGHGLSSYSGSPGDDEFTRRMFALSDALDTANRFAQGGQGSIPDSTWRAFIDTIRRQTYTLTSQVDRMDSGPRLVLGEGTRVDTGGRDVAWGSGGPDMVITEEEAAQDSWWRRIAGQGEPAPRTGGTTAPRTTTTTTAGKQTGSGGEVVSWERMPTGLRNLWIQLNPPGAPIYRKPITYVVAAGAAGLLYYLYTGSK
jgi:hypothetical protein